MNSSTNSQLLLDFEKFQDLEYPPDHPLTLALEFAELTMKQVNVMGAGSDIIEGWIRDQRPAFAIKLILDNENHDLYSSLCTFARTAAACIEEPEIMLRSMEVRLAQHDPYGFGPKKENHHEICSYRCCVCEGYAEAKRMDRVTDWLSRIINSDHYNATISRVTDMLLKQGQLETVERWAETLPVDSGSEVLWTKVAGLRLQRGEVDIVIGILEGKLGGAQKCSLGIISGLVDELMRANRRSEVEKWTEIALVRIPLENNPNNGSGYVPFDIICACEWLGKREAVEYLWPLYRIYSIKICDYMAGRGCYGIAMDHYISAAAMAHKAGFNNLTDRVAALYQEYMQNSNSPPKTVAEAKEQLLARIGNPSPIEKLRAQKEKVVASMDFEANNQRIDALPEQQRESDLCRLLNNCVKAQEWNHAIATLIKISKLPNPLNGKEYVRGWGREICVSAGHMGILSEANRADLRQLLAKSHIVQ